MRSERGGFVLGLVVGLLIGLALALGVALYITKAPIPFINKVPQRTPEQDTAEAERNRNWDPNAALAGKAASRPAATPSAVASAPAAGAVAAVPRPAAAPAPAAAASTPARPGARDPAALLAGAAADGFVYFVQAGAYTRSEDAEQQRARLGLLGQPAKVSEREQAGRTVYRVRIGPFGSREEADGLQTRLQEQSIEAQIVRVEKP